MALRKFVIEREVPKIGALAGSEMRGAAGKSNEALRKLAGDVQWVHSYVADDKTFCIYLASDEGAIREACRVERISGQSHHGSASSDRSHHGANWLTVHAGDAE